MKGAALARVGLCLASLGCATVWPRNELISARSAYQEASVSRAASFDQERLAAARRALDRAEGAELAAPGTPEARALAYVALRRAELAKVAGDYGFDRQVLAELEERKRRAAAAPSQPVAPNDDAGAGAASSDAGESEPIDTIGGEPPSDAAREP